MHRSVLEGQVAAAAAAVRAVVAGIDPDSVPAGEAQRVFEGLDRIVRCAAAGRTLLARRVVEGQGWKREGFASAAEQVASLTGSSLGAARGEIETSKALSSLPATAGALAGGVISSQQGAVIADAARVNPGAEASLLETAAGGSVAELREAALQAKAAADRDPRARHRRQHRQRRLTRFTDAEGARHLSLVGPLDTVSLIEAELDRRIGALIRNLPAGQALECRDALAFDAAVEMARRSERADDPGGNRRQTRPQHLALLRLDITALWRGHVEGDELCEVTGLGPIPVEAARRLLGDAVLKLIVTKGDAVAHVTSLTRGPTQAMRYALLWTQPTCSVQGCTRTILEHDHRTGAEYKHTRHTRLHELDPLCKPHHHLHTTQGWALVTGTGNRPMVPPHDPRHPRHTTTRAGPDPPPAA